jgi:hypothetical protein
MRAGLSTTALWVAAGWLLTSELVACSMKRVKQSVYDSRAFKRFAFWSIALKGQACLTGHAP